MTVPFNKLPCSQPLHLTVYSSNCAFFNAHTLGKSLLSSNVYHHEEFCSNQALKVDIVPSCFMSMTVD